LLKLKQKIGSLRLIPSSGGVFEVTVNGQKIYSKIATGQFPEPNAIVDKVRSFR
jgi:selenoprotein W-related protein